MHCMAILDTVSALVLERLSSLTDPQSREDRLLRSISSFLMVRHTAWVTFLQHRRPIADVVEDASSPVGGLIWLDCLVLHPGAFQVYKSGEQDGSHELCDIERMHQSQIIGALVRTPLTQLTATCTPRSADELEAKPPVRQAENAREKSTGFPLCGLNRLDNRPNYQISTIESYAMARAAPLPCI